MREEIDAAVNFLLTILKIRKGEEKFKMKMEELLLDRYQGHWYPTNPWKGSAYRCIRNNVRVVDPVMWIAAEESQLGVDDLNGILRIELTMWVDPGSVCYRIGDRGGSICYLFMK